MIEIKPCPFCGGRVRIRESFKGTLFICNSCGASVRFFNMKRQPWRSWGVAVSIEKYNHRADQQK